MKTKCWIVFVVASILILVMTTTGGASYSYTEETVMLNTGEAQCVYTHHWTGDDAEALANSIDRNYYLDYVPPFEPDELCSEKELRRYTKEVYEEPGEKGEESKKTIIDGIRGEITDYKCDYGKYRGFRAIEEDIMITCTATMKWDLKDRDEHVYIRTRQRDIDFIAFTVLTGWIISSVEDIRGDFISPDKRTVSGFTIADEAYSIKFSKIPTSTQSPSPSLTTTLLPSQTPTVSSAPIPTQTPTVSPTLAPAEMPKIPEEGTPRAEVSGFTAVLALIGLLGVAYLLRKRE